MTGGMQRATRLERTRRVHRLFRGADEVAKYYRAIALFTEITAAVLAACGGLWPKYALDGWNPLVLLILLVLATALRIAARSAGAFAGRARRLSLEAFALGTDLNPLLASNLSSDAPVLSEWLAERLPAKTMEEYYRPTFRVGRERLRELYAHSAFYSWQLLRSFGKILFLATLASLALGAALLYWLALDAETIDQRDQMLNIVMSIVFSVVILKLINATIDSYFSSSSAKTVADGLLRVEASDAEHADDLIVSYNIGRSTGAAVPTWLYKMKRERLDNEWAERRQALIRTEAPVQL